MDDLFDNTITLCTEHNVINCLECEKESLRLEKEYFFQTCGSCIKFVPFIAESGFCKINKCNCICKNPESMIDFWNDKCKSWKINPIYLEMYLEK